MLYIYGVQFFLKNVLGGLVVMIDPLSYSLQFLKRFSYIEILYLQG